MNSACRVFVRAFVVAGQLGAYAQADDLGCPKFLPPIEENYLDSIQNEVKAAPHQTELLLDNVIVSSSPIIKVARLEIKPGAKLLLPDSSLFAVVLAKELVFSGTPSGFTLQIAGEGGHAANGFPGPSGQNGMCRPLRTQAIIFSFGSAFGQNSFPMGWLTVQARGISGGNGGNAEAADGTPGIGGNGTRGAAVFFLTNENNRDWLAAAHVLNMSGLPGLGGFSRSGSYGVGGNSDFNARVYMIPSDFKLYY